jgi:thiol-disulfide isomerase/thioredoxin
MNLFAKFEAGLPLAEFLDKYATDAYRARWRMGADQTALTDEQRKVLSAFKRRMNVLVLGGAWCGDCSSQCPIFEKFAEAAPVIHVRYIDRDEHADAQAALQINGGNRVPVIVFFSEDGFEVMRYGERTLAHYRRSLAQLTGEGCSTGLMKDGDPVHRAAIQEWLDQFERVQLMLRLSTRLRNLHGD